MCEREREREKAAYGLRFTEDGDELGGILDALHAVEASSTLGVLIIDLLLALPASLTGCLVLDLEFVSEGGLYKESSDKVFFFFKKKKKKKEHDT